MVLVGVPLIAAAETPTRTLSAGTILPVQLDSDAKMKLGTTVKGHLTEPVYVNDELLIPAGTSISGQIVALPPASHHRRLNAKLEGDFTPLHDAAIEFRSLTFSDGSHVGLTTAATTQGIETLHIESAYAAAHPKSLPKRVWADLNGRKKDAVATFTAPGKAERLKRTFYGQLPYHPEILDGGVEFNAKLSEPLQLPVLDSPAESSSAPKGLQGTATLHALLTTPIESDKSAVGTAVSAVVTEPFFDAENKLVVPQGSVLTGKVTQSDPAGRWGHNGILRFTFSELKFPAGFEQRVYGTTSAVSVDQRSNLQMNVEGGVSREKSSALLPLAMGVLSAAALHEDEASLAHAASSSNGFALIGRALAIGTGSNYVGGAIGAYGTARTAYARFIARGSDVTFPKDTRIEIAVDPITSQILERH